MDKLRRSRGPMRAGFTKTYNELTAELAKIPPDQENLKRLLAQLELKYQKTAVVDEQILTVMLDDIAVSDEDYLNEYTSIEEYSEKLVDCRLAVDSKSLPPPLSSQQQQFSSNLSGHSECRKKFRLPKLELPTFGGELKDWLGFWGLFKKVHEDEELEPEDKFQFLLQSITPGSRARELVDGYPPTAENYTKVIESLKSRFGKDELLIEVYVRELLGLVLRKAGSQKEKLTLTKLYDQLDCQMRSLDTLGVTMDKFASVLYPMVESCIPEEILRAWQRSANPVVTEDSVATSRLTLLMSFLRSEVEGEERIKLARAGFGLQSEAGKPSKKKETPDDIPTAAGLFSGQSKSSNVKTSNCIFCEKSKHSSKDCYQAQKMSCSDKNECIQKKRACFICLNIGHQSRDCKSNLKCAICSKSHQIIMCPEHSSNKSAEKKENEKIPANTHSYASFSSAPEVALQTLIVKVRGKGKVREVRAIVDSGSQRSYVVDRMASEVGLVTVGEEKMIHTLFGGSQSEPQVHRRYEVVLGHVKDDFNCKLELLGQARTCNEIPRVKRGPWLEEVQRRGIWLSDIGDSSPEIEVLLGADVVGKLFTGKVQQLKSGLTAVETSLGWTLLGRVPGGAKQSSGCLLVTSLLNNESNLSDLWKLDTLGITDTVESKSREVMEAAAKKHFLDTVKINSSGRYEVHLPWIEGHPPLPSNRTVAERRLQSATKKLMSDGRINSYQQVFDEWKEEGIIEVVPDDDVSKNIHYLPHRAVIKENSATTKVRPVFDASAREKNHPSLNDCLEKVPNLIELIPSTVMRFRMNRIGVVSDIKKAFLQIRIDSKDCDFLRFLWWQNSAMEKTAIYRHRRAVFGVTCSPFLLPAVLEFHLARAPSHLKATAEKLGSSFYVDNCVTSVNSEEELVKFVKEAQLIMSEGKFDLRGWEHTWMAPSAEEKEETPLLGMIWNKKEDSISCDTSKLNELQCEPTTKRKILSIAHKVYDIIGFTCPVLLYAKKLLQKSWKLKVGWDTELPSDISVEFLRWCRELKKLEEIKIPRWMQGSDLSKEKCSLHTFSDASKYAFATCVFLRVETEDGVSVQLVQAKSRVAPLEELTIPRLELLSCLIGCRLTNTVIKSLSLESVPHFYWTDATTALCWIQRDDLWATFVGNRVKEIRSLSKVADWRHVPGVHNPADLPSRGCSVRQLIESKWWEGPAWLRRPPKDWPVSEAVADEADVNSEKRRTVTSLLAVSMDSNQFTMYFSCYDKIINLVAWMNRFCVNAQSYKLSKRPVNCGSLTVKEREEAEERLLRLVQLEFFTSDCDKKLKSLSVTRDESGLLRVNTKIGTRADTEPFKSPILLPANHRIVELLIRTEHLKNSHAGVQTLLTILREKFWIVRGRKTIRSVLSKCQKCRRYEVKHFQSVSVALPVDRVKDADVFEVTGVDLAGPLFLKAGQKAWIVLYTCAVYRAVHLELVTSLSTDAFLLSFRRFIARRGRPAIVYSDNGTNFVGAENLFSRIDWRSIETYSASIRIQWKFNPPSAPWWGGWWERIVSMVKNILRRVLGKASLDFETLNTVICDCESVINARPLTYVGEDCSDLAPISPSSFLQERREVGVPELDHISHSSLNRKLRHRQQLIDQLRKRFRSEYLGKLVQRSLSKGEERQVVVGDIVLVGSDNVKRLDWPLAKIVDIFPGRDGNVRVVRLKTASGELNRPIQRVFPLEVVEKEDPVRDLVVTPPEVEAETEETSKKSQTVLRTRSGRKVNAPVKYSPSFSSFIIY